MDNSAIARPAFLGGCLVGVAGIVGYASVFPPTATGRPSFLSVAFVGIMCALGALAVGGAVGFLFGVPRTITVDGDLEGRTDYSPNTNLEQVSDWLTKILIGATLVQLGAAVDAMGRLFTALGPSFGGRADSATFAGALLVYFTILGFAAAWLSTRLYLAAALSEADRLLREAAAADRAGHPERASQLRQAAFALTKAGQDYEALRSLPAGSERTRDMERLVGSIRAYAAKVRPPVEDIRAMFDRGGPGDRVAALAMMQGNLDAVDVDIVCEVIGGSISAFEQYHALLVANLLAERDKGKPATQASAKLVITVREALDGDRSDLLDEERRKLAKHTLTLLETRKA